MEDYNQVIFCNYVWETLNEQDSEVIDEFVSIMTKLHKEYLESGGTYPTIEYVLGLAKDTLKSKNEMSENEMSENEMSKNEMSENEMSENEEEKKERVRQARLKFYNK